jgi:heme exporter protein C
MLNSSFPILLGVTVILLGASPLLIGAAPYESTMGLVQKIFYFHLPAAFVMFVSTFVCGWHSARFLFGGRPEADRRAVAAAELAVLFGAIVLVTGPLWGRKAWGVYWQWDARLTSTLVLWLILVAYILVRRYAGPGSERLGAALALFGTVNVPFIYVSVNIWRTVHPRTTVVPTLDASMALPLWWCVGAFFALYTLLFVMRVRLEDQRARLDTVAVDLDLD